MNIKSYDKSIRELLNSKKQLLIPRFQREYSWDKKNYQEFFEDMVSNLVINESKIEPNQYFLGTMLFVGNDAEGSGKEMLVVDGQQRLTTITILFSVLSDIFISMDQNTLSQQIFAYIMTSNDDGEEVRILKSNTHYPFFAYFIQDRAKEHDKEPTTEEEVCIKNTYDYFINALEENKLKNLIKKKNGNNDNIDELEYIEILKALRNQVLDSLFVLISTENREQANKIFEILNAKGKNLAHIDLIKNKIFEVLYQQEPVDIAEDYWTTIKKTLNPSNGEDVGLATFYRHFWISKYNTTRSNALYDAFKDKILEDRTSYECFLKDLTVNAEKYMQIINPKRDDYSCKKEYFPVVQSLKALNDTFGIVQTRIAILALFDVKERKLIKLKNFTEVLNYLENFHFAYNAIVSGRANRLETIYAKFAIKLRTCNSNSEVLDVIKTKLYDQLDSLYPSIDEFVEKFILLSYSKGDNSSNLKTKYAINKLNCYFSEIDVFDDSSSIEHIVSECEGECALNIGNLIALEVGLNNEADSNSYNDKKKFYTSSNYKWVKKFVNDYPEWDKEMIYERANSLAETYYRKILKK